MSAVTTLQKVGPQNTKNNKSSTEMRVGSSVGCHKRQPLHVRLNIASIFVAGPPQCPNINATFTGSDDPALTARIRRDLITERKTR